MRSNLIKLDKPVSTNKIECGSIDSSLRQNLHKLILNKLSGILDKDINKGIDMIEQLISKEEMDLFRSELNSKFLSEKETSSHSINYNRRLDTLKSCFEGLPADSVL